LQAALQPALVKRFYFLTRAPAVQARRRHAHARRARHLAPDRDGPAHHRLPQHTAQHSVAPPARRAGAIWSGRCPTRAHTVAGACFFVVSLHGCARARARAREPGAAAPSSSASSRRPDDAAVGEPPAPCSFARLFGGRGRRKRVALCMRTNCSPSVSPSVTHQSARTRGVLQTKRLSAQS
jgi:hypothetical protein